MRAAPQLFPQSGGTRREEGRRHSGAVARERFARPRPGRGVGLVRVHDDTVTRTVTNAYRNCCPGPGRACVYLQYYYPGRIAIV